MDENEMLTMNDGKYDTSDIELLKKNKKLNYIKQINDVLNELKSNPYMYFESELPKYVKNMDRTKIEIKENFIPTERNQLMLHSPKYHRILSNLFNEENVGLHLLYSNFRTLEGIGIFKIILDFYGYTEFKIRKKETSTGNIYSLEINNPYYYNQNYESSFENKDDFIRTLRGRKFYALYTGKEDDEEKEIIRNIYNGELNKIPVSLKNDIIKYFYDDDETKLPEKNNLYGELIKLLIISSSGAEGIDLKNVRFVHIMEPYWHPVRIEQVIGRAKRICSHKDLPKELQDVKVYMYLLVHNNKLLKEKPDTYAQIINVDSDRDGNVTSTDEKLYNIMIKKKQLMEEFLVALKESSIDCFVNYEHKEKCLSFPLRNVLNPKRTLTTKIKYSDNAYETIKKPVVKMDKFGVDDEDSDEEESEKIITNYDMRGMNVLTMVDGELKKVKYAVDVMATPYDVYEYDAYVKHKKFIKIGTTSRNKDKKLILTPNDKAIEEEEDIVENK